MIELYHKLLLDNNFNISKLPKINPANPNITHLAKTCENVFKFINLVDTEYKLIKEYPNIKLICCFII